MDKKITRDFKISAWIKYYLHEDPDNLSDEQYWKDWQYLQYCLIQEGKIKPEGSLEYVTRADKKKDYLRDTIKSVIDNEPFDWNKPNAARIKTLIIDTIREELEKILDSREIFFENLSNRAK